MRLRDELIGHVESRYACDERRDIVAPAASLAAAREAAGNRALRWTYEPRPDLLHSTIFRALKDAGLRWGLGPWRAASKATPE